MTWSSTENQKLSDINHITDFVREFIIKDSEEEWDWIIQDTTLFDITVESVAFGIYRAQEWKSAVSAYATLRIMRVHPTAVGLSNECDFPYIEVLCKICDLASEEFFEQND